MTIFKRSYFQTMAAMGLAVILAAVFARRGSGEGKDLQTVRLNVHPLSAGADPGPTMLVGAESQPGGYSFVWADAIIEGRGDCRIYFDYKDKDHFHFLDRKGSEATLGLREAGVEQVFSTGKLKAEDTGMRVARHGCKMGVFQAGALVAFGFDDRILEGAIGFRMLNGGEPVAIRAETRDAINFAEDFMITQGKSEQWRGNGDAKRGDFEVKSLRHPLLSANAFSYFGAGANIYSVTGENWWDNYVYELSMRGPETGSIGLIFAYQDEKNYGLFRWGSRGKDGKNPATRQLVRVRNGQEEIVAQAPGGYAPDQWYKATVNLSYARLSVQIDKHVLLETTDAYFGSGAAGVWCDVPLPGKLAKGPKEQDFIVNSLEGLMRQHAVFDDVRIRSQEDFEDRFATAGPLKSGWLVGEGDWTVTANARGNSSQLAVRCAHETKALIGDRRWSQYQVSADIQPVQNGVAGIVLMHRDESNYYVVKIENNMLKLVRVAGGVPGVIDNAQIAVGTEPIRIKVVVKKGHILATADDAASVEAFDGETRLRGRAGLYAASAGNASAPAALFSSVHVEFIPEAEPLVTNNAIFDEEVTMAEWSNTSSEWVPPSDDKVEVVDNKVVTLLWHRSQFPGDVELMAEPREVTESNYVIALSCSKDGLTKNNGYVFRYTASGDEKTGKQGVHVEILKQGELVLEKQIGDEVRQLSSVAIRRCGKYVVGLVNGRAVLSFRDSDPLKGSKVAFKTQNILVKTESMRITSDHFRNDTFSGAPVSWRTAGSAIAEVTNRWQCDPRWTFFSLQNDMHAGKAAVLWSKQLYPGDVTVEFYFGNKMDHLRGNPYTYARDVNVTIGSDGADLTKGYTFSFGGNNNSTSYIMRNGVIVKQFPARIPTDMNYHRHWFAFKAERQGNQMKFRVDHFFQSPDKKVAELIFEDTQPIQGDRVAIWTYDHGIMISKVRISGDNGEDIESPDFLPGPVKTVYDNPAAAAAVK